MYNPSITACLTCPSWVTAVCTLIQESRSSWILTHLSRKEGVIDGLRGDSLNSPLRWHKVRKANCSFQRASKHQIRKLGSGKLKVAKCGPMEIKASWSWYQQWASSDISMWIYIASHRSDAGNKLPLTECRVIDPQSDFQHHLLDVSPPRMRLSLVGSWIWRTRGSRDCYQESRKVSGLNLITFAAAQYPHCITHLTIYNHRLLICTGPAPWSWTPLQFNQKLTLISRVLQLTFCEYVKSCARGAKQSPEEEKIIDTKNY
jgi:hypothetical protein